MPLAIIDSLQIALIRYVSFAGITVALNIRKDCYRNALYTRINVFIYKAIFTRFPAVYYKLKTIIDY